MHATQHPLRSVVIPPLREPQHPSTWPQGAGACAPQVEEASGQVQLRLAEAAAAAPDGEDDDEDESSDEEVYDVEAFRQELDAMEAEGEDAAAQAEAAKWCAPCPSSACSSHTLWNWAQRPSITAPQRMQEASVSHIAGMGCRANTPGTFLG